MRWLSHAAFACALSAVSAPALELPCAPNDRECARAAALKHPVQRAASWADALELPVEDRLGPASDSLVMYLNLDNIAQGYPEKPRAAVLSDDFLADLRAAMAELPASVKRVLSDNFAGIYLVEELGGTGYTDYIRDSAGIPVGCFVVLDAAVLRKRSANEWATWKENTPFAPDPARAIRARIESDANDTRRYAMQYILLHELGHVASLKAKAHPRWDAPPSGDLRPGDYPFFALSWRVDPASKRYVPIPESDFDLRSRVVYYQKPALSATDVRPVYSQLAATSFPTLYAATSPGDDFAEAFANYVHVVLMKRPFEISMIEDGRVAQTYRACWEEPRCREKRRLLERMLAP